jgi:tetratricopeptide (TPR) repeat protein
MAWAFEQKWDKAIQDYNESIRLDPKNAPAHLSRAEVFFAKKEHEKALKDLDEAIRLDSKNPNYFHWRAWVSATSPEEKVRDGKKALADAKQACELTKWKVPCYLEGLAAAHAESGDFDEAVKWQRKVVEDPSYSLPEVAKLLKGAKERLKLYESMKPYRDVDK